VTLESARKIARQRFAQVELGIDPAAEKAAAAATKLALGMVLDRYLQVKQATLRPRTYTAAVRYFTVHWASLRNRALPDIKRADIAMRLQQLVEAHGPLAAARAREYPSASLAWAMREGLAEFNPCVGTNDPAAGRPSRERVLADRELAVVWQACGDDSAFSRIAVLRARNSHTAIRLKVCDLIKNEDAASASVTLMRSACPHAPIRTAPRRSRPCRLNWRFFAKSASRRPPRLPVCRWIRSSGTTRI
jgi:hypothetical protein